MSMAAPPTITKTKTRDLFHRTIDAMTDSECEAVLPALRLAWCHAAKATAAPAAQARPPADPARAERIRRSGFHAIQGGVK